MSKLVQCSPSSVLIAATFHQLALKPRFQWQWQMSKQWLKILIVALNKEIKANLFNYAKGANSIGIMNHTYNPWNKTTSGDQKRTRLQCYIMLPKNAGEPDRWNRTSWWETLPAPKTCISLRKRAWLGEEEQQEEQACIHTWWQSTNWSHGCYCCCQPNISSMVGFKRCKKSICSKEIWF